MQQSQKESTFYSLCIKKQCPQCNSFNTKRRGKERGLQTWSCHQCGRRFRNQRRRNPAFEKAVWSQYVFGKQTIRELQYKHHKDTRILRSILQTYIAPAKTHVPRKVNVVADALYFGERKEHTSWCVLVIRDPKRKENLWWGFFDTETTSAYRTGRDYLEELGYEIMSVTGDGFAGIREAFYPIPFQMCHVHMERLVIHGTTRKPELSAGQALLALARSLHTINGDTFRRYFAMYIEKYRDFLNEKTTNPLNGTIFFTHEPLRRAVLSTRRFLPFLFIYEQHHHIPRTSNSLEGHFAHMRDIAEIHRGLKREQKEKVLHSILLASTVAPTPGKLKHVV